MVKLDGIVPSERSDIQQLPGVGQYICNAILLFVHNEQEPLLDVNMARVVERVFGDRKLVDIRYDPYLQSLARMIVNCSTPSELNWAVIDLAATVCRIRVPRCLSCPLKSICRWYHRHQD